MLFFFFHSFKSCPQRKDAADLRQLITTAYQLTSRTGQHTTNTELDHNSVDEHVNNGPLADVGLNSILQWRSSQVLRPSLFRP